MLSRPLLEFCLVFIAGIYFGSFAPLPTGVLLFLSIVLLALAGWCYLTDRYYAGRVMALTFFTFGLTVIGLYNAGSDTPLVQYQGEKVTITGELAAEPDVRPGKVFYLLQARQIEVQGKTLPTQGLVRITVYEAKNIYAYGDVIKVTGKLTGAESPGNPGQFDYRKYLARHGIHVIMHVQQQHIQKIGVSPHTGLQKIAFSAKEYLSAAIYRSLPTEHAALVEGMLFGARGMIPEQVDTDFQITSLVHVLSVSGFHVGLVLAAFLGLARLVRLPLAYEAPLGSLILFFYAVMTGMGPAVIRAAVMGITALWAKRLGRERDWPTAMALAAAVILLFRPWSLWEPGFQLSFAVTWGILYLTPPAEKMLSRFPRAVRLALVVPVVAELTAAPLVCYHFNMISLVGIAANIIAAPLITAVMLFSALGLLAGLIFSPAAEVINVSAAALIDLLLWLVHSLASLPHSSVFLPSPPWLLAAAYYLLLGLLPKINYFSFKPIKVKLPCLLLISGLLAAVLLAWQFADKQSKLTVHFIDVGQGDAALVQTPNGRSMLIDTGGWSGEFQKGSGAGSQVVLPYLQRLGINSLDVLLLSHPHEDHAGGAGAVINRLPVKLALVSPVDANRDSGEKPDQEYKQLLDELHRRGIPVKQARAGDFLKLDDQIEIKILAPAEIPPADLNDCSLVVKISYCERSFLFTGDIEKEQQQALVQQKLDLKADVLKVPHHGSGNLAAEFFQAVDPKVAVISVGRHNRFGHPAQAVIDLLQQMDARVYRTDQDGAVVVSTDGMSVWVDTGRAGAR